MYQIVCTKNGRTLAIVDDYGEADYIGQRHRENTGHIAEIYKLNNPEVRVRGKDLLAEGNTFGVLIELEP